MLCHGLPRLLVIASFAALWLLLPAAVLAQPGLSLAPATPPRMDELRLSADFGGGSRDKARRVLKGVIMGETRDWVDFTEIRQPQGRPMSLVVLWRFPKDKIDLVVRLEDEKQRQTLLQWIEDFKSREQNDAEALKSLKLVNSGAGQSPLWHYESPLWLLPSGASWLEVDSTAEQETTERCVLRIEQVLAAYQEVLPQRVRPTRPLHVKLFGTMREFQQFLADRRLPIVNPALFSPRENLLVAGSELSAYADQLTEVRKHHQQVAAQLAAFDKALPDKLAAFRASLKPGGMSDKEQNRLVNLADAAWKRERQDIEKQIHIADRKNDEAFNAVTHAMFARLFHEAFHAYLENYVYPQAEFDVPRWLNEGLAQIFEGGQLEGGALRLDAPDAKRLKALQDDLHTRQKLNLAEVLLADQSQFLVLHPGGARASTQYYLYSWGLAWYLAFRQPVLETAALDEYVRKGQTGDPLQRFERLVGMKLDKFEDRWRADMLSIKATQ